MKKILFLFIILLSSNTIFAQIEKSENFYVSSVSSALFDSTSPESKQIISLSKYDNLQIVERVDSTWGKFKIRAFSGYILLSDLKPGKAIVTRSTFRTGARCKDGSRSSATGRGACSHHGGVRQWITSSRESVRVVNN